MQTIPVSSLGSGLAKNHRAPCTKKFCANLVAGNARSAKKRCRQKCLTTIHCNGMRRPKSHQLEALKSIALLGSLGNNCGEGRTCLVNKIDQVLRIVNGSPPPMWNVAGWGPFTWVASLISIILIKADQKAQRLPFISCL